MNFEIPPTHRRVPAAATDSARRSAVAAKTSAGHYADVMEQVVGEPAPKPTPPAREVPYWQEQEFGFGDVLDVVNPLHHIPIVATLYRNLTDDKIGFVPRLVGGALWGRIGGLVAGVVNSVVEWFTGKDVGDHIFATLWGERQPASPAQTARAAAVDGAPVEVSQEIAQARAVVEAEPAAVAPAPVTENLVNLPAEPIVPKPSAVTITPLPGINHWHDPLESDAMVSGARLRLRA